MVHYDHQYQGRFYNPPHALVARIECSQPTRGGLAAWAGVQGSTWDQAGVYSDNATLPHAYTEHGQPYKLVDQPDQTAVVRITRGRFGFWTISLNGRTVTTRAYGLVWAGVERIGGADGDCTVNVTTN